MTVRGEFEAILRDAKTGEVVQRFLEPNIITNPAFEHWATNNTSGSYLATVSQVLCANKKICLPSRTMRYPPGNIQGNQAAVGSAIPGITSPEYYPAAGGFPPFAQWSTRLPLPTLGTTRTINTVMLTDTSQGSLDSTLLPQGAEICAYAKLSTPCVQTDSQFFDLYYRIYFQNTMIYDTPAWVFDNATKKMIRYAGSIIGGFGQAYQLYLVNYSSPYIFPVAKTTADKERIYPSANGFSFFSQMGVDISNGPVFIGSSSYYRRKYSQSLDFTDLVGKATASIMFGTADQPAVFTAVANVDSLPKIQTLIGHRATSNRPFFDVDFLQQGTGSITLSGTWNNRGTPAVAGMYATGKLQEIKYLIIDGGGAVGVAGYRYRTRPFTSFWYTDSHDNEYYDAAAEVPVLCASQGQGYPEEGRTLLGPYSSYGIRQLTSWCAYDETSVVVVKAGEIVLYNVATAGYWIYTGSFTDVRQVAVVNGKIYLACHNTGLHVIDPVNSTTVTAVPTPAVGIDCSVVYGVARGFGNTLWVVANNCLASYDGVTWTKYDPSSTPPFDIAGVSDSNWANIEYLIVDETSSDNQMILVRRFDATVSPTSLGVWWSTATAAANAFAEIKGGYGSNVRAHRGHISGRGGNWIARINSQFYRFTFGQTTAPTAITTVSANNTRGIGNPLYVGFTSIMWVQNASSQWRFLSFIDVWSEQHLFGGSTYLKEFNTFWHPRIKMIDPATGTVETQVDSTLTYLYDGLGYIQDSGLGGAPSVFQGDLAHCFLLGKGRIFNNAIFGEGNHAGTWIPIKSWLGVYPYAGSTYAGGSLAYLGDTNYGWNGSAWVAGLTTPRPTHNTVQTLADGVSLKWNDGSSGTSFIDTDYYNFAVFEGLLKDNASTSTYEHAFYYKRAYKNQTDLSGATTIPGPASGPTGAVTLDLPRSCNTIGITANGSNQFVFAGENHQQYATVTQQVAGQFDMTFAPTSDPNCVGVYFGVGYASTNAPLYYIEVGPTGTIFANSPSGRVQITGTGTPTIGPITGTTCQIRRTGLTQIDFLFNGQVRYSPTVPAGQLRFDVLFGTMGDQQPQYMIANRLTPACTITANGMDVALKIGVAGSLTGAYNPKFYAIDDNTRGALTVLIAGVPASFIRVAGEAPNPGEISVQSFMGLFQFHASDAGKTVSATYNYMTHE